MDNLQVKNVAKDGTWLDSEKDVSIELLELMISLIDKILLLTDEQFSRYKEKTYKLSNEDRFKKLVYILEKYRNDYKEEESHDKK